MKYRALHLNFWADSFILQLTPEERYFYIYLLACPHGNVAGIYGFSLQHAVLECGYSEDTVRKLMARFVACGKIRWSEKTGEVAIKNWERYNVNTSPKVRACVKKLLEEVKDRSLIGFVYEGVKNYEEFWEQQGNAKEETAQTAADNEFEAGELFPEIESRYHIGIKEKENKRKENLSSANADSGGAKPQEERISVEETVEIYHQLLPDAPRVSRLNDKRRSAFKQRLAEDRARRSSEWWRDYFAAVASCGWLCGDNDRGFTADFEWLINGNNMLKVLEGRYGRLRTQSAPTRSSAIGAGAASQLKLWAQERALQQSPGSCARKEIDNAGL